MTPAVSEIIFNVLKHHFRNTFDSELLYLTEKLQTDLRNKRKEYQMLPTQKGKRKMETTLLFVDDNLSLVENTARDISEIRPQWRFLLAHSLAEARRIYNQCFPDAAVLDVDLPDGNGLDLLSELKHNSPALPVIMISGDDSEDLLLKVSERGGYSFFTKPFSAPILVNTIERAVSAFYDESPGRVAPHPESIAVRKNPHALARRPECQTLAVYNPYASGLKLFPFE